MLEFIKFIKKTNKNKPVVNKKTHSSYDFRDLYIAEPKGINMNALVVLTDKE